jgi:adenylate cyclase
VSAAAAKAPEAGRDRNRDRTRRALGVGFGLVLLVLLLDFFGAFGLLEYKSVDLRFRQRGPRELAVPAVLVAIDDESLNGWTDAQGQPRYMPERWLWPRDFYATVTRNLKEAGAKLIVFDVVFSESSKRDPSQDLDFADAAHEAGNVIFGEELDYRKVGEQDVYKADTLVPGLEAAKLDKGYVNVFASGDGFLRGMRPLLTNTRREVDPAMPLAELNVLRHYLGIADKPVFDPALDAVKLGPRTIPLTGLDADINYAGPAGTVPRVSFHDVYYKTADMGVFRDKVVYIGATAEILKDLWLTPFSADRGQPDFPGVEARIHFLDTLVSGRFLRHPSYGFEALLVLLLGAATVLLTSRIRALPGLGVALALAGGWAAACFWAFHAGWVLPLVGPASAVLLPFLGLAVHRGWVEERRNRETRRLFSRYVSRQIVDEILKDPSAVKLGGDLKEVTILFSDVRGFTSMSEKLSAPEVVEILNEYLTAMVDVVIANGGTVDKYVGDAIMAVWGSPLPDPDHRIKALRTAVRMMEELKVLQERWAAQGRPRIDIGIGVNTGHVVAGNMGHPNYKMDYTVIGDDVNLAARMESANKEMHSHILVTGASFEGCEDVFEAIHHPAIHVKGKALPVEVIEIIGWKGQGRAPWAEPLP